MIHAYDRVYLERARTALARMLDFATHELGYDLERFFRLFIESGMAHRFETGDCRVLVGMSGVELAYEVIERTEGSVNRLKPRYAMGRSEEYWTGWALAYYQWKTGLSFSQIIAYASIDAVRDLYHPYHEMDIQHFVDKLNEWHRDAYPHTNLKMRREAAGLSQRDLADLSGVPVRTIQQYEQRQKDINKAQLATIAVLAQTLACEPGDLLERIEE